MSQIQSFRFLTIILLSFAVIIYACSKGGGGTTPPPDPCAGVTVSVSGTVANPSAPGLSDGSITASASGSSGFTFSINSGAFQSSGTFNNLAAGSYTITAKSSSGCSGSSSFTLTAPNPCAGVTVTVNGTATNPTSTLTSNGSITVTASGSTGFTFNINGGVFQSSGTFSGLAVGSYTIVAKNGSGCTGSAVFTLTAPNPCTGVTITMVNTITANTPCGANSGSISIVPSGGTGPYSFSINSGTFQSATIFSNLGPASYTVTAKDANGCNGSSTAVVSNLSAGPLFAAVRTLIQNNCSGCHNAGQAEGGISFAVDCNIITNKNRVKARAVDASPSAMPPSGLLAASDRQKITDWINAGGKFSD